MSNFSWRHVLDRTRHIHVNRKIESIEVLSKKILPRLVWRRVKNAISTGGGIAILAGAQETRRNTSRTPFVSPLFCGNPVGQTGKL